MFSRLHSCAKRRRDPFVCAVNSALRVSKAKNAFQELAVIAKHVVKLTHVGVGLI